MLYFLLDYGLRNINIDLILVHKLVTASPLGCQTVMGFYIWWHILRAFSSGVFSYYSLIFPNYRSKVFHIFNLFVLVGPSCEKRLIYNGFNQTSQFGSFNGSFHSIIRIAIFRERYLTLNGCWPGCLGCHFSSDFLGFLRFLGFFLYWVIGVVAII